MLRGLLFLCCLACSAGVTAKEKIIFGTDDYAPYNYTDVHSGQLIGMSVDIVRAMLRAAGDSESQIRVYSWHELYQKALHEKNVAIFSIAQTPERQAQFKWVGVLSQPDSYIWRLKSRTDIRLSSQRDFSRYKIAVVKDGVDDQIFSRKYGSEGKDNIVRVVDPDQRFKMLFGGQVDIFNDNTLGLMWNLKEQGYEYSQLVRAFPMPETAPNLALAFSDETADRIVNRYVRALAKVKQSGEYLEILSRWTSQ